MGHNTSAVLFGVTGGTRTGALRVSIESASDAVVPQRNIFLTPLGGDQWQAVFLV